MARPLMGRVYRCPNLGGDKQKNRVRSSGGRKRTLYPRGSKEPPKGLGTPPFMSESRKRRYWPKVRGSFCLDLETSGLFGILNTQT